MEAADPLAPVPAAGAALVARSAELAAIAAVLDTPGGRGIVLTGSLGVGKTRLATEVMGRRAARGAVVLRAIATAATADIPLGALAPIAQLGVRAGDRRDAVVERVVADLTAEAAGAELLLVVDDVGLLDPQSHAVVRALLDRRVAKVVGTSRTPSPPLPPPWTGPGLVHLALNELDADGVAELLVSTLGGPVAGDTTRHLTAATGGNPLLLREALTAAGQQGSLRRVDGIWSLADGSRPLARLGDLVGGRLAQVSADARDAIELVAVAEVLPLGLADALIGPGVLAELERAGLVLRDTVLGAPVVRPAHPYYGEALRDGLGPIARRHHARRLADEAERSAAADATARVDPLRVVAWRVDAGGEVSADLLGRAAREARRRSEFDRAEDLASRAVAAGGGLPTVLLLGEIQNAVGRYEQADATFAAVVDDLLARGVAPTDELETSLVGLCTLALTFNRAWGLGRTLEARRLLRDVSALLDAAPPTDASRERRAEMAADAAALAAYAGDPSGAVAEAEALLPADLTPRVAARTAFAAASGLLGVGRPEEAVARSDHGLAALAALPEGFGRATFSTNLSLTRIIALADAGRLAEAGAEAEALSRASGSAAFLTGQAVSAWARGRVLLTAGQVVTAERWLREARLLERDLQTRGRRRWSLIALGLALAYQGRAGDAHEAVATLDRLDAEDPVDERFVIADEVRLRALLLSARGEISAAERMLLAGGDESGSRGEVRAAVVLWHEALLTATSRRTAIEAAGRLAAADPRVDGLLLTARRDDAGALVARDDERRVAVARSVLVTGAAPLARSIARSVLDLGAGGAVTPSVARAATAIVDEATAAMEGAVVDHAAPDALARLGPRQREVVLLAAQGLSNHDVAERLEISVRTVENHLHRAYGELGIDGRRDLVAVVTGGRPRSV